MAHLLWGYGYPNISRRLCAEPSLSGYSLVKGDSSCSLINGKLKERNCVVQCCTNSTSSAEDVGNLVGNGKSSINGKADQFGYLVSDCGWKVRRLAVRADEMREAAQVQAEAFYEPAPFFNDFFFHFFQVQL